MTPPLLIYYAPSSPSTNPPNQSKPQFKTSPKPPNARTKTRTESETVSVTTNQPIMKIEEQELSLVPQTTPLEIDKDLTLLPRIKLNLTVFPSTPSTFTNPIDEWKLKRALIDYLQISHSLSLPEEDLQIKRFKDLKKRKRDDPIVNGALRIWNLSFFKNEIENEVSLWRNRLVENMNGIELNLQGVRFTLNVSVSDFDDFDVMKKNWEEFYAFKNLNNNRSLKCEPDTIVIRGLPSRWFAEPRVSSKPSMLVTHTIFSKFGKIR